MSEQLAQESVSVPAGSAALAAGLQKLIGSVIANHKALSGQALAEVSADVTAAVADLGPVLSQLGMIGDEVKADPIAVAEAFVIAGAEVAKSLVGSPSASSAV